MRNVLTLSACLVLLACQPITVQHHEEGPVPVSVRVDDAAYWLEEWYRVIDLPTEQIELALESREQAFARDANPRTRLRLALLLATGPSEVRDQSRAHEIIAGLDEQKASDSAKALAALLRQMLDEQLWSADRIAELKAQKHESDARIIELEQQLQALTNIEQSIQQRETPGDRKETK